MHATVPHSWCLATSCWLLHRLSVVSRALKGWVDFIHVVSFCTFKSWMIFLTDIVYFIIWSPYLRHETFDIIWSCSYMELCGIDDFLWIFSGYYNSNIILLSFILSFLFLRKDHFSLNYSQIASINKGLNLTLLNFLCFFFRTLTASLITEAFISTFKIRERSIYIHFQDDRKKH